MSPRAGVAYLLTIGDELIAGEQRDLNSAWQAQRLAQLGYRVEGVRLVGDDEEEIAAALTELAPRASLILCTGGLGPTLDDLTRHAVARAAGRELVRDAEVVDGIRRWFEAGGRTMTAANERQALFPEGATRLENSAGTAPGFRLELEGCDVAVLPGPPREMKTVFEEELAEWLGSCAPVESRVETARFYLFGLPESDFADRVGEWMDRDESPRMGVRASGGVLKVKLEARGVGSGEILADRAAAFRERLGRWIFSETSPEPAEVLAAHLIERRTTFACAESCTGGELASRLIAQPGISAVFLEGFVTYSNAAKVERLGVPEALLEAHGAVSPEVAEAMARGASERSGARLALSTTGVAGPDGGTPEKPVGLVHVGIAFDGRVESHELRLPARGRAFVRTWAVNSACDLARRALLAADA